METATYVKICCPRCGGKDLNIIGDRDIGGSVVSGMGVSAFAGTKAGVICRGKRLTTENILDLLKMRKKI